MPLYQRHGKNGCLWMTAKGKNGTCHSTLVWKDFCDPFVCTEAVDSSYEVIHKVQFLATKYFVSVTKRACIGSVSRHIQKLVLTEDQSTGQ